jgi:hypothetical protein
MTGEEGQKAAEEAFEAGRTSPSSNRALKAISKALRKHDR